MRGRTVGSAVLAGSESISTEVLNLARRTIYEHKGRSRVRLVLVERVVRVSG